MTGWLLLLLSWGATGGHVSSGVFVFAWLVHIKKKWFTDFLAAGNRPFTFIRLPPFQVLPLGIKRGLEL